MLDIDYKVHLSYKDILLVPYDRGLNTIQSRNDPDISSQVTKKHRINIPLISSPMDTITEQEMIVTLDNIGAMGIHTRYINHNNEQEKQLKAMKKIKPKIQGPLSCAIGVKAGSEIHAQKLLDSGVDIICVDIANGNHIFMYKMLEKLSKLKDRYDFDIIAGNVASASAAKNLVYTGVSGLKVGIGPGGSCTTRRVTGFGVPQLTAIMDCYRMLVDHKLDEHIYIIADGGIRHSGDCVKALWAGASTVMAGYIFAGHQECPSPDDGCRSYQYRGMSSRTVSGRSDVAPEGVSMPVSYKGSVTDTVRKYAAAIKAGLSMANANNIKELRENVKAIRVSTLSTGESDPVQNDFIE